MHEKATCLHSLPPHAGAPVDEARLAAQLGAVTTSEVPRIRDIDLAVRLEYARPRDIRKLIARLAKEGKLPAIQRRCTAQRQTTRRGERAFDVEEFWLTELEALKIAGKSDTDRADALMDEVYRVFLMAKDGLLPASPPQLGDAALVRELHAVKRELATMRDDLRLIVNGTGCGITSREATALNARITKLERYRALDG